MSELQYMIIKPVAILARVFIVQPSSPFLTVAVLSGWHDDMQSMKLEGLCYSPKIFKPFLIINSLD